MPATDQFAILCKEAKKGSTKKGRSPKCALAVIYPVTPFPFFRSSVRSSCGCPATTLLGSSPGIVDSRTPCDSTAFTRCNGASPIAAIIPAESNEPIELGRSDASGRDDREPRRRDGTEHHRDEPFARFAGLVLRLTARPRADLQHLGGSDNLGVGKVGCRGEGSPVSRSG